MNSQKKYLSPEQRMFQNSITKSCGVFHCHESRHWKPMWDSIIKRNNFLINEKPSDGYKKVRTLYNHRLVLEGVIS